MPAPAPMRDEAMVRLGRCRDCGRDRRGPPPAPASPPVKTDFPSSRSRSVSMRRAFLACVASIGVAISSSTAYEGNGGWYTFWERVHVDFYRNNTWPEPFLSTYRTLAREPFCIKADNGWNMKNTIGTFLYDRETQKLNEAGELLVRWIVTQAPQHRRVVFVLKGDTADATKIRVESVQQAVAKYASGHVCPVVLTDTEPNGWSAQYIDSITQQFNNTIPAPRLPGGGQAGGSSGSSSGGGGGSGGSGSSGSSR